MKTPVTTTVPADRLRFAIARLARLLRQQDGGGFGPTVTATLSTIERHGPMSLSEVAVREQVAPPSITKIIEKLVAAGLVRREPDPTDRRASLVSVTAAGTSFLASARTKRTEWLAARLDALDADEQRRLEDALEVLEKLTAHDGGETR